MFSKGQLKSPSTRFQFTYRRALLSRSSSIEIDLNILVIASLNIGQIKLFVLYCKINDKNASVSVTGSANIFNLFYHWPHESHHASAVF